MKRALKKDYIYHKDQNKEGFEVSFSAEIQLHLKNVSNKQNLQVVQIFNK